MTLTEVLCVEVVMLNTTHQLHFDMDVILQKLQGGQVWRNCGI